MQGLQVIGPLTAEITRRVIESDRRAAEARARDERRVELRARSVEAINQIDSLIARSARRDQRSAAPGRVEHGQRGVPAGVPIEFSPPCDRILSVC